MRSFNTKLNISFFILLVLILGGAYGYVRIYFTQISESFAREIVSLTQNNASLIDRLYQEEYTINKRRFNNLVEESITFSPELALVQVLDTNEKVIFDSKFTEASGTRDATAELTKKIRTEAGEEYVVDPQYCATRNEIDRTENMVTTTIVNKLTQTSCEENLVQTIELLYPHLGKSDVSIRYVFTYERMHAWLITTLILVSSMFLATLILYAILYRKIARPLGILRHGAIEMARGNLQYKVHVQSKNELGTIANFMNEVARNLRDVISDLEEKERLTSELDVASKIQRNLLPQGEQDAPELPGLDIVGRTRSSSEVGGDIFNFIEPDENRTIIYIGDVTGHGVPAGLVMIMVDVLLHVFAGLYASVRDILINVNANLAPRIDTTLFVTMLLFNWDVRMQQLHYASAGHEHIIHYHAKTNSCEAIQSGGLALGMVLDNSQLTQEKSIDLEDGDAIILYTDGVTEAKNATGELFGLNRLKESVDKFGYRSAQGIFDALTKVLSGYIGEEKQRDDVTMIVMKHRAATPEEIERRMKKARLSITEQKIKREHKAVWDWEKPAQ